MASSLVSEGVNLWLNLATSEYCKGLAVCMQSVTAAMEARQRTPADPTSSGFSVTARSELGNQSLLFFLSVLSAWCTVGWQQTNQR